MNDTVPAGDLADWDDITETGPMLSSSPAASMAWRRPGKGSPSTEITLNKMLMDKLGWRHGATVRVKVAPDRKTIALLLGEIGKRLTVRARCGAITARLQWVDSPKRKAERISHQLVDGVLLLSVPQWAWLGAEQRDHPVSPPKARTSRLPPAPVPATAALTARQAPPPSAKATPRPLTAPVVATKAAEPPPPHEDRPAAAATAQAPAPASADPSRAAARIRATDTTSPPPEDLAEAEAMIRSGKGANDLREEFGWEHRPAVDFAHAIRAKMAAEAHA